MGSMGFRIIAVSCNKKLDDVLLPKDKNKFLIDINGTLWLDILSKICLISLQSVAINNLGLIMQQDIFNV